MNLATTLDLFGMAGPEQDLYQIGDSVSFDEISGDGDLMGTLTGKVTNVRDGFAQVRTENPVGRSKVHLTKTVPIYKLRRAPVQAIGEPTAGNTAYSHIDPTPAFHPPSARDKRPVPVDNPGEKDDRFLDVTQRNDPAVQRYRNRLARRNANIPVLRPDVTTAVGAHQEGFAVFGGGPGSGCTGPNCGRKPSARFVKDNFGRKSIFVKAKDGDAYGARPAAGDRKIGTLDHPGLRLSLTDAKFIANQLQGIPGYENARPVRWQGPTVGWGDKNTLDQLDTHGHDNGHAWLGTQFGIKESAIVSHLQSLKESGYSLNKADSAFLKEHK